MKGFGSALVLAGLVSASDYPRFDEQIDWYGYTWTDHVITTDDGYELVTFRITGDGSTTFAPDKPPIVIMHGMTMDASSWLEN